MTALAQRLLPQKDSRVQKQAEQAASYAEWEAGSTEATQEQRDHAAQARSTANAEALDLASRLAADPTIPPLVTFAGFLGGTITANADPWRVFYLDAKLLTWLLVREEDIVQCQTLEDDSSALGQRDVIWLKSSASVTEGSGSPRVHEIEAQFLRGDFIGAGDFSASLTGGTFSRATGLLCEVQTPGCCGRYTR